jgi:hypothetical protein
MYMQTFVIDFNYEKKQVECFVQKIHDGKEAIYILNFTDSFLIKRFNGKRLLLAKREDAIATNSPELIFQLQVWNAIIKKESRLL